METKPGSDPVEPLPMVVEDSANATNETNTTAPPSETQVEQTREENGLTEQSTDSKASITPLEKDSMDEDRRRREPIGNMEKIEKEFADLKEKFFSEKMETLKKEIELIKAGTHQGFLKKCKELEDAKEHKCWAAEKWREYQLQNIEACYLAEKKAAEDEHKADRKLLKERMLTSTSEKRKKLAEEKNTMNLTDLSDGNERNTRTTRRRGKETKEPPTYKRRLNPPHIAYTLKEHEISEDLTLIQKSAGLVPLSQRTYTSTLSNAPAPAPYPKTTEKPTLNTSDLDVWIEKGKLYYHNQVLEKGKEMIIESKSSEISGKWHGVLDQANPAEIILRSSEGNRSKFPINQLRSGKYVILTGN